MQKLPKGKKFLPDLRKNLPTNADAHREA